MTADWMAPPPPPDAPENGILDHEETWRLLLVSRRDVVASHPPHHSGYGGLAAPAYEIPEVWKSLIGKGLATRIEVPAPRQSYSFDVQKWQWVFRITDKGRVLAKMLDGGQ